MNTKKLLNVHKSQASLRAALTRLEEAGIDVSQASADFKATLAAFETHIPGDIPTEFHIRSSPIPFGDHVMLGNEMLPVNLHPASSAGRAYKLTKGQRAVLRDQFGMTPTTEVIVDEIAVWPAAPTAVAHIVIRSTEHIPDRRRHVLNAAVITDWAGFCSRAKSIDEEVDRVSDKEPKGDGVKVKPSSKLPTLDSLLSLYS